MALKDIVFALKLDKREYDDGMDSAKGKAESLNATSMAGLEGNLRRVEQQATRTSVAMGKIESAGKKAELVAGGVAGVKGAGWAATKATGFAASRVAAGTAGPILAALARRAAIGAALTATGTALGPIGMAAGAVATIGSLVPLVYKLVGGSEEATESTAELSGAVSGLGGTLTGAAPKAGLFSKSISLLGDGIRGVVKFAANAILAFAKLAAGALAAGVAIAGAFVASQVKGFSLNADLETATAQFKVFTGSAMKADAIVKALQNRADITPFDTKAYVEGGTALMSAAGGSQEKLMELMKTAEMLTVLNPAEGLSGAAVALKNALSGDFTSFQDRFNIDRNAIKRFKDAGLEGQKLVRAVLGSMNVTEASVAELGNTWKARLSTITSFIDNIRQRFAKPMFDWVSAKMQLATQWIATNKTWVLSVAEGLGAMLMDKIKWLGENIKPAIDWVRANAGWIYQTVIELVTMTWEKIKEIGSYLLPAFEKAKAIFSAAWAFLAQLPARLKELFDGGKLMSTLQGVLTQAMQIIWDAVSLLGSMIWDGVMKGVPILAKEATIAATGAIPGAGIMGDMAKSLGIMTPNDERRTELAEAKADLRDGAKEKFAAFAASTSARVGGMAGSLTKSAGSMISNDLGVGAFVANARVRNGGGVDAFGNPILVNNPKPGMGDVIRTAYARGNARTQQAEAMQNAEQAAPAMAQANAAIENLNKAYAKADRGKAAPRKIQLVMNQPMHPVGTY